VSLHADNVSYTWRFRGGTRSAVRNVSAEFTAGTAHAICGPSGSGKSTLSYLLAGMLPPERGAVRWDGRAASERRGEIAYVFQFPESIYFEDSVRAELEHWAGNGAALKAEIFDTLGIPFAAIAEQHPYHLSAGYGRLVAIALQLAREPKLLVLDEPTIGLDWEYHARMVTLLRDWVNAERTLVVVTHDLDLMRGLGGRTWVMAGGELAWQGETTALLARQDWMIAYGLETP
jgi:energy-coupling factor transport system ATP-binding protein